MSKRGRPRKPTDIYAVKDWIEYTSDSDSDYNHVQTRHTRLPERPLLVGPAIPTRVSLEPQGSPQAHDDPDVEQISPQSQVPGGRQPHVRPQQPNDQPEQYAQYPATERLSPEPPEPVGSPYHPEAPGDQDPDPEHLEYMSVSY